MSIQKKSVRNVLLFSFGLFFLLILINKAKRSWFPEDINIINGAFYGAFILFWMQSVSDRVISRRLRRDLLAIGSCMLLWMVLRECRYEYVNQNTGTLSRILWYAYYVPFFLMALLSFRTSFLIEEPVNNRISGKDLAVLAGSSGILLLILTNDWHQLMFTFLPGMENWSSQYGRGPLFFMVYGLIFLMLAGTIFNLTRAALYSPSRRWAWLPLLPLMLGILYWITYPFYKLDWIRFPELTCFLIGLGWEISIQTGLVPSNTGYPELFSQSHLNARFREKGEEPVENTGTGDKVIHSQPIAGGEVVWEEDVSLIRRLEGELKEAGSRLSEEVDLLQAENRLKEEREKTIRKTAILDQMRIRFSAQKERITELISEAEESPEHCREKLLTACVIGVYIKRSAAMMLSAGDTEMRDIRDLLLCLSEEADLLEKLGITCRVQGSAKGLIPTAGLLEVYAAIEDNLEIRLPVLQEFAVRTEESEDEITLTAEYETEIGSQSSGTFSLTRKWRRQQTDSAGGQARPGGQEENQ